MLIVGDYTARIGDPSGRSEERPVLPGEVLDRNAKVFAEQAFRVLDRERTEIRFNGEWLGKLSYAEVVGLARTITVARILERDDFAQRFAARKPISISELLYPLMQAYDSVAIEADIEIGGTDQLYNLLAGRDVMQDYGLDPQLVVTYPLLVGLDGAKKMAKSQGNYIGINEPPDEMFGKTMSIPDKALDSGGGSRWTGRLPAAIRWSGSSSSRGGSSRAGTGRRARRRRRSTSRASCVSVRRRTRWRGVSAGERRCTCRPCSSNTSTRFDERGPPADRPGRSP